MWELLILNLTWCKKLVKTRPELAKASYDWGFGDVESALGAASHMGRKDIAEFLIEHGARPDVFTFAMLGKLKAVKAMIDDMPGIQKMHGPHGFTLMHHAKMRLRRKSVEGEEKKRQEALVAYLESLGDADKRVTSLQISPKEQKKYLGTYSFGSGTKDYFKVAVNSMNMLSLGRGEDTGRVLHRTGDHTFAPSGAPSVSIKFQIKDNLATELTIHDPIPVVSAMRI